MEIKWSFQGSGSQLGAIWEFLETLFITPGGIALGIYWVEARDADKDPVMPRTTSPQERILWPRMSIEPWLINPVLRQWFSMYRPWQAASTASGNSLERQILSPYPNPDGSEILVVEASVLCFNKPSRGLRCTLKFENHWIKEWRNLSLQVKANTLKEKNSVPMPLKKCFIHYW